MSNDFTLIYSSPVYLVYLTDVTKLIKNQFGNFEIHATVFKPGSSKIKEGSKFLLTLLLGPNPIVTFEPHLGIVHITDCFGTQHNFATFENGLFHKLIENFPDA